MAATTTIGAIQEVLIVYNALKGTAFGGLAGQHAAAALAGFGVVCPKLTANHDPALVITRCALPRGALQAVTTGIAVVAMLIIRAGGRGTRTLLCRITLTRTCAADGAVGSELALVGATVLVCWVAV